MVGKIGINPNDFGFLTPRETSIIYNAWLEKQIENERQNWDRTRWETTFLINIQLKPKDRKTPQQMFAFSWDKELTGNYKPSSEKRFKELVKKWG